MSQMKNILSANKLALLMTTSLVVSACNTTSEQYHQTAEGEYPQSETPAAKIAAAIQPEEESTTRRQERGLSRDKLMRIADRAWKKGNPSTAMRLYGMAAQKDPGNPAPLIAMGNILRKTGKTSAGIQLKKRVLEKSPDYLPAHIGIGYALMAEDKPYMAAQAFETAIALAPKEAKALGGMAVALDTAGEHAKAQDYYRLAVKAEPNNLTYQNNLALSLSLSGRTDQAIAMLEIITAHPNATAQHRQNLALVYGMAGKSAEAMRYSRMDLSEKDARNNALYFQALTNGSQNELAEREDQAKAMAGRKNIRKRNPETSRQPHALLEARDEAEEIGTAPRQTEDTIASPVLRTRPHFDRYARVPTPADDMIASVETHLGTGENNVAAAPIAPVEKETLKKPAAEPIFFQIPFEPSELNEDLTTASVRPEQKTEIKPAAEPVKLMVPYDDIDGYYETVPALTHIALTNNPDQMDGPHYYAQLGSFRSEARAHYGWEVLQKRHNDLLGSLSPIISKVELGEEKGVFYRIRVGAYEDGSVPGQLCEMLIDRAQGCYTSRVAPSIEPTKAPLIEAYNPSTDPEQDKVARLSRPHKEQRGLGRYDSAYIGY